MFVAIPPLHHAEVGRRLAVDRPSFIPAIASAAICTAEIPCSGQIPAWAASP